MSTLTPIKTLPWGEEVYLEVPLNKGSGNSFYARHSKSSEGREYIEFYKYGTKPGTDGERFVQKLKLFNPMQWLQIKRSLESELISSIGWDLDQAQVELEGLETAAKEKQAEDTTKTK
jgi:hypothetical protein